MLIIKEPPNFAAPDALIFDMDGTLWDAVETYAEGFNDYFKESSSERRFVKDDLFRYMGMEEAKFLEIAFPEVKASRRSEMYQKVVENQYRRIEQTGGQLYDGVKEGLNALSSRYKLFIVSNCPEFTIQYFVKWAGIEPFITDSMAHGVNYKPKHENIRHLINKHQLKSPLYVGDTESDARESRKVPLPFVYVDYGFGATDDYDLKFSSFPELTNYFLSGD